MEAGFLSRTLCFLCPHTKHVRNLHNIMCLDNHLPSAAEIKPAHFVWRCGAGRFSDCVCAPAVMRLISSPIDGPIHVPRRAQPTGRATPTGRINRLGGTNGSVSRRRSVAQPGRRARVYDDLSSVFLCVYGRVQPTGTAPLEGPAGSAGQTEA